MNNTLTITPPDLTGYQKDFLYCKARFTVVEASTKTGKTFSHIWWLYERAHGYDNGKKIQKIEKGMQFWWVAPVYAQAEIAFNRLWNKIVETGLYKSNKQALTITTPAGAVIMFKTAKDPDNLYGEDVHACVFDEFTRAKQEAWFALRSTLTYTKAPCKFIGNYKGKSNWGHQLAIKSETDPEYKSFRVTAWDAVRAGILDEDEVLQAQKDLPPFMFKALYLAEGEIDDSRLVEDDAIKNMLTNSHIKGGKKYITADLAFQGSDKFVIGVWDGLILTRMIEIDKSDGKDIEDTIKGLAERHRVVRSNIIYDGDGVGMFLEGYLKGAKSFKNNAPPIKEKGRKLDFRNLKSQCYFKLANYVNDGKIWINCDISKQWNEVIEEFECIKNRSYKSDAKIEVLRKTEIFEIIGRSPDRTDMFMMRMYFEHYRSSLSYG